MLCTYFSLCSCSRPQNELLAQFVQELFVFYTEVSEFCELLSISKMGIDYWVTELFKSKNLVQKIQQCKEILNQQEFLVQRAQEEFQNLKIFILKFANLFIHNEFSKEMFLSCQ